MSEAGQLSIEKLQQELSLKQLQINSLLTITQAINDNVAAPELYSMYKSFIGWEMGIKRMALFSVMKMPGNVSPSFRPIT